MKLEDFICDNVELDKVNLHLVLRGMREVLELGDKFNGLVGQDVDIKIEKHREKRSLNANSYERVLEGKIADALGTSKPEVHNTMLCRYGKYLRDKSGNIIFVLVPASVDYSKEEEIHLKPTGKSETRNGELYYWYATMQPSHQYDSQAFAQLLDGVVSEAKELGIEVLTPDEIKRMEEMYGKGDDG